MFVNENHHVTVIHHVCDALMRHRKLEFSHHDKYQQLNIGIFTSCGKYQLLVSTSLCSIMNPI